MYLELQHIKLFALRLDRHMIIMHLITQGHYPMGIHTTGCVEQAQSFVNSNLVIILGAGGGLLVFQIVGLILSIALAVSIGKEKAYARELKESQKQSNLKKYKR